MSASSTTSCGNSYASCDNALPNASRNESPLAAISAGASEVASIQPILDFLTRCAERAQSFVGLRFGEFHTAVPRGHVFHERHAFAFRRMRDDAGGPAMRGGGATQRRENGRHVVAVDFRDSPVEGAPLRGQR